MRTPRTLACIAAALALTACGSEQGTKKPVVRAPWGQSGALGASLQPARWAYLPTKPLMLSGKLAVDAKHTLFVGQGGERWLRDDETGDVSVAEDRAQQTLVDALRWGDSFLFVSAEQGIIYEAGSPLGPFREMRMPPEPFERLVTDGSSLLAITALGTLVRSVDGGLHYEPVSVGEMGVAGDIAMFPGGSGLLLTYPERLFVTRDGGAHWAPLTAPSIGATAITLVGERGFFVHGYFRNLRLNRDATTTRVVNDVPTGLGELSDTIDEQLPTPEAYSIGIHHGVMIGGRAMTVTPSTKRNDRWQLVDAKLGERARPVGLTGSERCTRLPIAVSQGYIYGACSQANSRLGPVTVLRWKTPDNVEQLSAPLQGRVDTIALAAAPDGSLLVEGVCREGVKGAACDRKEPLLLRAERAQWRALPGADDAPSPAKPDSPSAEGSEASSLWQITSVPELNELPQALGFSPGGTLAYVVGRRGKHDELALFVSRDGGATFEPRDLSRVLRGSDDRRPRIQSVQLSTSDDGVVSLGLETDAGPWFVVTDEDGRVLSTSQPPSMSSGARIGVAGRRALSTEGIGAVESLDGGISWRSLGDIGALANGSDSRPPVACAPEGCLIGKDLVRLGWGGAPSAPRTVQAFDEDLSSAVPRSPLPPPLVCRFGKEPWRPLTKGAAIPNAQHADRGKTAWAVAGEDPQRGSVVMMHALAQPAGKIEEVTLLPPVRDPSAYAVLVSPQVEGAAAIRFPLPSIQAIQNSQPLKSMEIAWENLFENKLSRATIPQVGPYQSGMSEPRGAVAAAAVVGLLNVSSGGVFLRPAPEHDAPVFFVDHAGHTEQVRIDSLQYLDANAGPVRIARTEMVRLAGKSVAVTTVYGGSGLLRSLQGQAPDAIALFSNKGEGYSDLSFTYQNGAPLLVQAVVRPGLAGVTHLFPIRSDGDVLGPVVRGPTQSTLNEHFRICDAQDRAKTPRVVVPPDARARRGVVVENTDGVRFAVMNSGEMVLYGTGDSPCAGSLEAIPVLDKDTPAVERDDRVIVRMNDLEHAWYFRAGPSQATEMRRMQCRIDPQTKLPNSMVNGELDEGSGGVSQDVE